MTIARRRAAHLDVIALSPQSAPPVRRPAPEMGVPLPSGDAPVPDGITPAGRLRRCTYRRIDRVSALPGRPQLPTYEVMCLYGDGEDPLALGDVEAARPICDRCTAAGIFRPDED